MKAMMTSDKCYSTLNGGHNPFNFDGVERTTLDFDTARAAVDFEVEKHECYDATGRIIPSLFHLTRSDSNDIIPSAGVGNQFQPIQHRDVFDQIVNDVIPAFPEMELETAGTLYGGGVGMFTFKVGDLFHIKGDKSPSEMRMFVSNPCNGYGSMVMGFTTVRLFCKNQIAAARHTAGKDGYVIRHTKNGGAIAESSVKEIGHQVEAAHEIKMRCERLAELGVSASAFEKILDVIYPLSDGLKKCAAGYARMERLRNEALEQFEGQTAAEIPDHTGWTAFNSLTTPIFNPSKLDERTDLAAIQYDGMMSGKAERVRKILGVVENVLAA